MSDRLFLTLAALGAGAMIAFAAVWPQGMGARSPGPFGHTPTLQTPQAQQAMAMEAAEAKKRYQAQLRAAQTQLRRFAPTSAPPANTAAPPAGLRSGQ